MARINSLQTTAEIFGVHRNTISNWVRLGMPVVQRADRARGVEWKLDAADMLQWRCDRAVADAVTQTGDKDGNLSRHEAERRKAVALAIVSEVEADDALKSVMSRQDAERLTNDFTEAIRGALSHVAEIVAERIAAIADPNEIRTVFDAEINLAYREAQAALQAKWASGTS